MAASVTDMKFFVGLVLLTFLVASGFAQDGVLDATDLEVLRAKAGTEAVVEGLVYDIGMTKDSSITFINIGNPKKKGFVALVFQKDYPAFSEGLDQFRNRKVRVKGLIKTYRGEIPQIILTAPDQIELVKE